MNSSDRYLVVLFASFGLFGLIEGSISLDGEAERAVGIIHAFINTFLIFAWNRYHDIENHLESTGGYRLLVLLFPPLGLPIYLYRYFGFKSGSKKLAKAAGFFAVLILIYLVPNFLLG